MNLLAFLIPAAHAQAAGGQPQGMGLTTLLFPVILIAIMYFPPADEAAEGAQGHAGEDQAWR